MHYRLYAIGIIVLLLCVGFSGCNEQNRQDQNEDNDESALPSIIFFSTDNAHIWRNETVNLSWSVENATSVLLSPLIGPVSFNDSIELQPDQSTTYILTAENDEGNVTKKITITVSDPEPAPPEIYFSVSYDSSYLLVTYVEHNLSWSNLLLNDQQITEDDVSSADGVFDGFIHKGDRLIDLQGNVTLVWKPTNQSIGTWFFS